MCKRMYDDGLEGRAGSGRGSRNLRLKLAGGVGAFSISSQELGKS